MNRFENFWLSDISKRVINELEHVDNWEADSYVIKNIKMKNLKLWIANGCQFLDIISPDTSSASTGLIPFKDRYIVWKYVKRILKMEKMNIIDDIFK